MINSWPWGVKDLRCGGVGNVRSLKLGRGMRWVLRKSGAGIRPDLEGTMQMVPPVIMIRTLDSVALPHWCGRVDRNCEVYTLEIAR